MFVIIIIVDAAAKPIKLISFCLFNFHVQVHSRGLKFGIYEDYGNFTCAGYPGILGSLELDAFTFAEWNVDFVKLDGCYSLPKDMDAGYSEFGYHLNKTGRPMVYSCSWPVYQTYAGLQVSEIH